MIRRGRCGGLLLAGDHHGGMTETTPHRLSRCCDPNGSIRGEFLLRIRQIVGSAMYVVLSLVDTLEAALDGVEVMQDTLAATTSQVERLPSQLTDSAVVSYCAKDVESTKMDRRLICVTQHPPEMGVAGASQSTCSLPAAGIGFCAAS